MPPMPSAPLVDGSEQPAVCFSTVAHFLPRMTRHKTAGCRNTDAYPPGCFSRLAAASVLSITSYT